jgi:serine/threonine protein kinase
MEGEVFGVDNCNQWRRAAVKISKGHVEGQSSLVEETVVMAKIGLHKNIIRMLGFCIHKGSIMLAMEYADHGDLRSYLLSERTRPEQMALSGFMHSCPPRQSFDYALQVANGMAYMASQQCIHRDLSARNVLVCSGEILKVSDFGLAKDIHCHEYYKRTKPGLVPLKWTAPEALIDRKYTQASDV